MRQEKEPKRQLDEAGKHEEQEPERAQELPQLLMMARALLGSPCQEEKAWAAGMVLGQARQRLEREAEVVTPGLEAQDDQLGSGLAVQALPHLRWTFHRLK